MPNTNTNRQITKSGSIAGKTINTFLTVVLTLLFSSAMAQLTAPEIEWQNTIGGNGNDNLYSIQQTTDGGYILGGSSTSTISGDKAETSLGNSDYWVVKLNSTGAIEWQNTIGGDNYDELRSVQQTTDGGYIIGGYSSSGSSGDKTEASLGGNDYWVVKLNSAGTIEWQNAIGGSGADYLNSVEQTTDGGYILGGYSNSGISVDKTEASLGGYDYWVVKLNSAGAIEWQNTIGGSVDDYLSSVKQTTDGGYILGGYSASSITGDKTESCFGSVDYWVVKVNSAGAIEWQSTLGGFNYDYLFSLQQTSDGGYILGGHSKSGKTGNKTEEPVGLADYWVVKLTSTGAIEWQNTIGGNNKDELQSIQQTTDGGYILGGFSQSPVSGDKTEASLGFYDYWVVKVNSTGIIEWQNTIGGDEEDLLYSIQQTSDSGYILGGYSPSDISDDKTEASQGHADYWVVKLYPLACNGLVYADEDGDTYGDPANSLFVADCIPPDGYVVLNTDCNDNDASIHPGACDAASNGNGVDDNCDGAIDNGFGASIFYADGDGDGYGAGSEFSFCDNPGQGYSTNNDDCNDAVSTIHPDAAETCNSIDDDCDIQVDENVKITFYVDADGDGYGNLNVSTQGCIPPSGYVANAGDCNDGNAAIHTGATEICNNMIDDNCNGETDETPQIEWQNTIGGDDSDGAKSIQQTSDGGYIVGGYSFSGISGDKTEDSLSFDLADYWVLKLNGAGIIEWQNTIGGSEGDILSSVQQTSDGGYIIGGNSFSGISGDKTEACFGLADYWVVKLNSTGAIEWQNTIGGTDYDLLTAPVQQTSDGGYILGGYSRSGISGDKTEASQGVEDYWVIKLNSTGAIEWQNTIGGSSVEELHSIQQTFDGGYILGGFSPSGISGDKTEPNQGSSDYWVVKLNSTGAIEWQNTIGGSKVDNLYSIQQTSEGGYILGGYSSSDISGDKTEANQGKPSLFDYWVVKLNNTGAIEWQNTIGGKRDDILSSVRQTTDGGYILGGDSESNISDDKTEANKGVDGTADYWVVKLSSTGAIEWDNTIGGSLDDVLESIQQTSDGRYILAGSSSSGISGDKTAANEGFSYDYDYWVVKLSPDGIEFCNGIDDNCDGVIDENCEETCAVPTNFSTNNITGTSAKLNWDTVAGAEGYKIRYRVSGTSQWTLKNSNGNAKTLNNLSPNTNYTWEVKTYCTINPGFSSDWSAKQHFTTGPLRIGDESAQEVSFEIYPNPAGDHATIQFTLAQTSRVSIKVFDVSGKEISTLLDAELQEGEHSLPINTNHFSKGVYVVRMTSDFGIENEKLIVQ